MKKLLLILALAVAGAGSMQVKAQKEQRLFQRWAVGVNTSTMGIGVDVSTTLSRHFMLRAGIDMMPNITFDADVEVDIPTGMESTGETEVNIEGALKRTQFSAILNIYPLKKSSLFIAFGAYVGGDKLISIKGHSPELENLYAQYGDQAGIIIGDYKLPVSPDGTVSGGIKVNNFRPYIGMGLGRAVPHKRLGIMFEAGVQIHGKPKVYSDVGNIDDLLSQTDADDDFSEILDKVKIYPVLKLRLCGRIF